MSLLWAKEYLNEDRNSTNVKFGRSKLLYDYKLKRSKGFQSLEKDILLKIFGYLKEPDLKNVIQVCQKWKYTGLNPILWKKLNIINVKHKRAMDTIMRNIWRFTKLEYVCVKNVPEAPVFLRQIARCLANLRVLKVRYCENIKIETMRAVLSECKHLEFLDVKGSSMVPSFYHELHNYKNIRGLNLGANSMLTIKNMISLSLNCHNLNEFHVSLIKSEINNNILTDEDCIFILSNLGNRLQGFSIDSSSLSDLSFQRLIEFPELKKLCLNRAYNLTGRTLSLFGEHLKNLESFKIKYGNQITGPDIAGLFSNSAFVKNLKIVDLTGCWKITDPGLEILAMNCPKLKRLVIKCCKHITTIWYIKNHCKLLEAINIAFCNILLETWLPIPENIKTIYINEGNNLKVLQEYLNKTEQKIKIKICISEYNNATNHDI